MDHGSNHKKAKGTKKCVIKQKLMFENYKDCLFNNKTVYRSQERFKIYYHVMYTEEVNKTALSRNDDKRTYSRSSIQNINNWRLRIWKNKCIIEFNRKPTRH